MGNSAAVTVFATFHPKVGHEEDVLAILRGMVADTRAEKGNDRYDLYLSEQEGGKVFHLFERYRDDAALQAHRGTGHFAAYRAAIQDHLEAPIAVAVLADVDVVQAGMTSGTD